MTSEGRTALSGAAEGSRPPVIKPCPLTLLPALKERRAKNRTRAWGDMEALG